MTPPPTSMFMVPCVKHYTHKTMMMTINLVFCTCLQHIKSSRKFALFCSEFIWNLFWANERKMMASKKRLLPENKSLTYVHIIIVQTLLYTISDLSIRTDVYSLPNCNPSSLYLSLSLSLFVCMCLPLSLSLVFFNTQTTQIRLIALTFLKERKMFRSKFPTNFSLSKNL